MKNSYIHRRKDNLIDMFIHDLFWLKVVVEDDIGSGGDYEVRIMRTRFVVSDPDAGADSSAVITTALINEINAGIERVAAFAGANANEILIRFDHLGQIPSSENYDASTTGDGSISIRRVYPQSYVIKSASNWDQAFADMQEVPRSKGHVSDSLRPYQDAHIINANQLRYRVRFLFNPTDYDLVDTNLNFFQIFAKIDGIEVGGGIIDMVMTTDQASDVGNDDSIIIAGTAPAAADFESATKLHIPARCSTFKIRNAGAGDLLFGFASGTGEIRLEPGEQFADNRTNAAVFSVRGDGAPTDIEIYFNIKTSQFIS